MCNCPQEFEFNRALIAEFHRVTGKTILEWQKEGLPVKVQARGKKGNKYCVRCVNEWRTEYLIDSGDLDYTAERARLTKEQADKLERERLREEGATLETTAVLEWVKQGDQRVRNKLLNIPSRCAPLVAAQKAPEVEKILKDVIYETLRELSDVSDLQCHKGGAHGKQI